MALRSNPAEPGVARLKGVGGFVVVVAGIGEKPGFEGAPAAGEAPSGRFLIGRQSVRRACSLPYQKQSDIQPRDGYLCGTLGTTPNWNWLLPGLFHQTVSPYMSHLTAGEACASSFDLAPFLG